MNRHPRFEDYKPGVIIRSDQVCGSLRFGVVITEAEYDGENVPIPRKQPNQYVYFKTSRKESRGNFEFPLEQNPVIVSKKEALEELTSMIKEAEKTKKFLETSMEE